MKRKSIYFLFILCSFLLISGTVYAEGESDRVDYKSLCSRYADNNERLNCCNQAADDYDKKSCKEAVLNKCVKQDDINDRYECCKKFTNNEDVESCKVLSNNYCSSSESVYISKIASNIKIVYEPFEYKPEGFDDPKSSDYSKIYYWMDIKIYNMTSELYIIVQNDDNKSYTVNSSQINKDGVIVLRNSSTMNVRNFVFKIYSNRTNCKGKLLRTIRLTLPKYNLYSTRNACQDIPEYYLCHQFINFDVDATNFLKNTEEYRAKMEKNKVNNKDDANKKVTVRKIVSAVSNHKFIFVGVILIIGVVVTVLVLKRRND